MARAQADEVLKLDPEFSSAKWAQIINYKNQSDENHYFEGLRKAGLRE